MSPTTKERLINALVALFWAVLVLIASTQISFNYTRTYTHEKYNSDLESIIIKLDYLIDEIDTLDKK